MKLTQRLSATMEGSTCKHRAQALIEEPQDQSTCDSCVLKLDSHEHEDIPISFTLLTDHSPGYHHGSWLWWVETLQGTLSSFLLHHGSIIKRILVLLFVVAYCVYLGYVFTRTTGGWAALIALTVIVLVLFLYEQVVIRYGWKVQALVLTPLSRTASRVWNIGKWVFLPCLMAGLVVYLSAVIIKSHTQGLALVGYCVFTCLTLLTSTHVTQIHWRPVVVGLGLQVVLAVLLLRVGAAYRAAHWLNEQVGGFLRHSLRGGTTAFGNPTAFLHPLVMVVCPVIIYVGATMAFLSHTGLTGYLTSKLSWLVKVTFNISHIEAKVMADGLLSGMMDYVMTFKGYVAYLTPSELHLTLAMAHSNLSGFMYGLFSVFWVVPDTLLLGALLAAPAGVALSKMNAPEVHVTHLQSSRETVCDKEDRNIAERTALGAWQAAKVVLSIIVQVTAFLSMYELFDVILTWIGNRANIELNFKVLFSYLFLPVAYLLGVPGEEARTCSYILGLSLSQNEILAYLELGSLRMLGTLTRRTEAITTAAICGFSSFASMTLVVGGWYTASPTTYRRAVTSLWRVYLITKMASFTTACLFGVLYDEALIESFEHSLHLSSGWLNLGRFLSIIPSYKQLLPWLGIEL